MAINFALSDVKPVDREDDPMNREWVGCRPMPSAEQVFKQNRGMWFLAAHAEDEQYATTSSRPAHRRGAQPRLLHRRPAVAPGARAAPVRVRLRHAGRAAQALRPGP